MPLGAQGGEGRNQEDKDKGRVGGIWKTGKENSLHPGLLALHASGKPGHRGSRGAPTSKGCSQHAEKLGWHPRKYFFHSMDRLLDYTTTWTFGPAITRRITLPCLVQGGQTAGERAGPGCMEGQEEGAEGGAQQLYSKDSRSG